MGLTSFYPVSMDTEKSHIDFDHLRRYVGDDPALMAEVFGLFKNQVDLWSSSFETELDDDSWAMMTHSLKGTAKAIGALELAEICEKAESLVGEGRRDGSRTVAIENLELTIDQVLIEIQRWEYRQTMLGMKS